MLDTPRLTRGSTKAAKEVLWEHFISLGKNNMETVHGCLINDTFLVGILITKYIHIGYLMKNRCLGWQSSTSDKGKNNFFLINAVC